MILCSTADPLFLTRDIWLMQDGNHLVSKCRAHLFCSHAINTYYIVSTLEADPIVITDSKTAGMT